jgi:hypothetical protein
MGPRFVCWLSPIIVLALARDRAGAQPAPPPPTTLESPVSTAGMPLADRRFAPHVILRIGHFAPIGNVARDEPLSSYSGPATMVMLGGGLRIGSVVTDFVIGIGGAGASEEAKAPIAQVGVKPRNHITATVGLESVYQFRRGSTVGYIPWVGAGLSYAAFGPGGSSGRLSVGVNHDGPQLRPMAGIDLPLNGWFGVGIAAEAGLGVYTSHSVSVTLDDDPFTSLNEERHEKRVLDLGGGTHAWMGLSARVVFFP